MTGRRIMPGPPPGWQDWETVMREALHEAAKAASAGEVPVGAVVLDADGTLIGRGHNTPIALHDPTAHAEIAALRQAATVRGNYRLDGCLLAVTLEPCLMCVGAIVHARIKGLVFGASDVRAGAVTSCLDGLELPFHNHVTWQAGGILEQECAARIKEFFVSRREKRG